jgi:hypothetical protein
MTTKILPGEKCWFLSGEKCWLHNDTRDYIFLEYVEDELNGDYCIIKRFEDGQYISVRPRKIDITRRK